ncbi:RrF2 family transcriptional regulator [Amaricoccus solimangrovi]|uniref:Rrf2 family transcriptional regulator n=1 Tax=Amaricoccus solimangrovi TaxID=2589815 RepID=A0A501WPK4_9RHOB|nr:Rrf2 family transcriptional regulator [Amaricoccus solimangrovi]TPE51379.1 Rrf2 family transcriptional regulator [Amaricoccus solimangrovi]
MISQKTKYAIKALITLAQEQAEGGASLRIEEIANRSNTPKRFLEHILIDIRNAGVIGSRRGRDGGYMLIKPPESISISDVLRMIDGPIAPLPCLSRRAYQRCEDCLDERTCRIRKVFGDLYAAYLLMVESLTLADLMRDDSLIESTPELDIIP